MRRTQHAAPGLAQRAAQLTSAHGRRRMARALRRTVSEAREPAVTRGPVSMLDRHAVLESDDAIQATIARLASPGPVAVKGMAMLERMFTDAVSSPLYHAGEPGVLRQPLLAAKLELGPVHAPLPIAA